MTVEKTICLWKFAVAFFTVLNLLILLPGSIYALPGSGLNFGTDEGSKVVNARGPTTGSGITTFHFLASGLCSESTDQCISIRGGGSLKYNEELKAKGYFSTYSEDSRTALSASPWKATNLVNSNPVRLHFKAVTTAGNFDIALTEGKGPHSGLVCVWGTLEVAGPKETLCTNKVLVYIT